MQYFIAMRNQLAVENYFLQSCTGFQTIEYVENFWFLRHMVQSKQSLFVDYTIDIRNQRPGPANVIFDDWSVKQMKK